LKNKLNLPASEHPIAAGIAEVENEKENLLHDVLRKTKESLDKLQRQVDTHICTIVMPANIDDPTA